MDPLLQRINVVGTSGSGKSTLSKRLSMMLDAPHVEMDALFWGPNWRWPSDEEFFASLDKSISGEHWVLDGNYSRTTPIKWKRVQTVVWLDYSFARTFLRTIRRATRRSITREELWPGTGNRESFRKSFLSKDSIILWSLRSYRKVRRRYQSAALDSRFTHISFVRLRTPKETETFLEAAPKRNQKARAISNW